MPRAWRLVLPLLLVGLAFGPAAVGQGPAPASSVALALPGGPVEIPLGGGHAVSLEAAIVLENFVCPQASAVMVDLAVRDVPSPLPGVRATAASLEVEIPPGAYPSTNPFSGTGQGALDIQVGMDAMPRHAHEFEVTAAFPGGTPPGCVAMAGFPAAEAVATHRIVTGPASPAAGAAPADAGASAPRETAPEADPPSGARPTPGPGLAVAAGAAAAAAMGLRRRR